MRLANCEQGNILLEAYANLEANMSHLKRPLSFLPPVIENMGDWNAFIDTSYQVYKNDFIANPPTFMGKRVVVDKRVLDGKYMEGFWHVVQRDMRRAGNRYPDFQRAERTSWIKPLILNPAAKGVEYRRRLEGKREIRHYLLAPSRNYVVILGEKKKAMFLVTAFCIDRSLAERAVSTHRFPKENGVGAVAIDAPMVATM